MSDSNMKDLTKTAKPAQAKPAVVETKPEVVETKPEVVETKPEVVETKPEVVAEVVPVLSAADKLRAEIVAVEAKIAEASKSADEAVKATAKLLEEEKLGLQLKLFDARIADLRSVATKMMGEGDDENASIFLKTAATLRAERFDFSAGHDRLKYADNLVPTLTGAPEGKFALFLLYDGGKCVSASLKAIGDTKSAMLASTETKGRDSVSSGSAKANFVATPPNQPAVQSGDAERHAPAGWTSKWTYKGTTWAVTSLGFGSYRLENGGNVREGIGNAVLKGITGSGPNIYDELGLPGLKCKFDIANPPKGWNAPTTV